jgi:hypothetical protein
VQFPGTDHAVIAVLRRQGGNVMAGCQHSLDVARAAATALQYLMGRSIEFHRQVLRVDRGQLEMPQM